MTKYCEHGFTSGKCNYSPCEHCSAALRHGTVVERLHQRISDLELELAGCVPVCSLEVALARVKELETALQPFATSVRPVPMADYDRAARVLKGKL